MDIKNILIESIILVASIPLFGRLMEILIGVLQGIFSKILGRKLTFFLFNWVTFIGVWHHELSHALFAFITGAKIKKIVLFHPTDDSLGYVEFSPRGNKFFKGLQSGLSAVAPVVCGIVTSTLLVYSLMKNNPQGWVLALIIYSLASIVIHMTMSHQDFKMMWKGMPVIFPIIFLFVTICTSLGIIELWQII